MELTKEFLEGQLNGLKEKLTNDLKVKEQSTVKLIDEKLKALESLSTKEELQKALDEINIQKERVDKLAEKRKQVNNDVKVKNFNDAFMEAYNEKKDELLELTEKSTGTVNLTLKTPVDIGLANTLFSGASDSQVQVTTNTGVISQIRSRLLTYLTSGVSVGSIGGTKAMWTEEVDEKGNVIPTAELVTKPNISVGFVEKDEKVKKYPAFTKVSTELMADAPQLISRIQSNVLKRINLKIEADLFAGDGTGEILNGLTEYATDFTGGSLADNVDAPNNYDVIRAIALQVTEALGTAGAVFVDAGELAKMDLEKDGEGRYLLPPFKSADGATISGVRLIPTTAFVGNASIDFIGGDLSVVNVLFREGLNIQIDRSGNDFIDNKMTILGEARLVQFVSGNDTQVLVKGTFAGAKTLLDSAV